jgi:hypothetical protein
MNLFQHVLVTFKLISNMIQMAVSYRPLVTCFLHQMSRGGDDGMIDTSDNLQINSE